MHAGAKCVCRPSLSLSLSLTHTHNRTATHRAMESNRPNVCGIVCEWENKQNCQTEANAAIKRRPMLLFSLEFMRCQCVVGWPRRVRIFHVWCKYVTSAPATLNISTKKSNFADVDFESRPRQMKIVFALRISIVIAINGSVSSHDQARKIRITFIYQDTRINYCFGKFRPPAGHKFAA